MNIRSELHHALHPRTSRIFWLSLYLSSTLIVVAGIGIFASHIRTRILAQGTLSLTTNYSTYVVGEPILYTVSNQYNSAVYLTDHCPAEPLAIYKKGANGWTRIHGNADIKACTIGQRQTTITSLSKATSSMAPWQDVFMQPGSYRLVAVVDGSTTLPYVDFAVIAPPLATIHTVILPSPVQSTPVKTGTPIKPAQTTQTPQPGTPSQTTNPTKPLPSPSPPTRAPQTYTLAVNNNGTYAPTSLTLYSGDAIRYVYTAPIQNEVRTRFTSQTQSGTSLSSVTLDSEYTSRTITYSAVGTWSYKADDHNGNSGTLTIK